MELADVIPRLVFWIIVFAAVAVVIAPAVGGLTRRVSPRAALPGAAAAATVAALVPTHCGVLQSFSPITSCSSLSGYSWRFQAAGGTVWAENSVAVAQGVVFATALVVGAVVGLTSLVIAGRNRGGSGVA